MNQVSMTIQVSGKAWDRWQQIADKHGLDLNREIVTGAGQYLAQRAKKLRESIPPLPHGRTSASGAWPQE